MRKKGFTMLELIMVIGIIMVLIVTFRNLFQNTNKDYLYAETCINKIHGDMNNFIYSAITSRGLYKGTGLIFPKLYVISIQPSKNQVELRYKENSGLTGSYIKDQLASTGLNEYFCKNNNYSTILSGNDFDIMINKDSIQDQTLPTFTINGGQNIFTKSTEMQLCYTGNICKEIANFTTDIRIQSIKKKKCILINKVGTTCLQRDQ